MDWKKVGISLAGILFLFWNQAKGASVENVMKISYLGRGDLPRGMRNNNPGNIKIAANPWQGKIPVEQNSDGTFEQFYYYVYGVRALIRLIRDTYMKHDGLTTLQAILNKFAPNSENPTSYYIEFVSLATGLPANQILYPTYDTVKKVVLAIADFENGKNQVIPPAVFDAAWEISA